MIKKISLPVIIIAMVIQLLVPVGMIIYSSKIDNFIIERGTEYKFKIQMNGANDGDFHFKLTDSSYRDYFYLSQTASDKYITITTTDEGFSEFSYYISEKPSTNNSYINNSETNIQRMNTFRTDTDFSCLQNYGYIYYSGFEGYVVAKVYNGQFVVQDMYIDDIPLKEWMVLYESGEAPEPVTTVDFDSFDSFD